MGSESEVNFKRFVDMRGGNAGQIPPPVALHMGFELTELEPGRIVLEMDVDERYHNPMGTVHGGTISDLADAAMGITHLTVLDADAGHTTLELKINFLKAMRKGRLRALATVKRTGRTIGLTECDVLDEDGNLIAHAVATQLILRG